MPIFIYNYNLQSDIIPMRSLSIIIISSACIASFAGPYDHLVVPLARYAPTAKLSNTLAKAENNVRDGKFSEAAAALDEVINAKDQAIKSLVTDQGPFPLVANTARLRYLMEACQYRQPDLAAEGEAILAAYTNSAGYTRCTAIMSLLGTLMEYCNKNNDMNAALEINRLQVKLDPQASIGSYVRKLLDRGENPATIRAAIKDYRANGGGMHAELGRLECELVRREGGDVLGACMAYLDMFPDQSLYDLKTILDIARAALDVDKPETITKYHKWMTTLAVRQPGDDAHMEIVSYLMGEQKKLEALVPELVKSKTPKSPTP